MRYKDEIQCAGHTLVQAVRQEAREAAPHSNGDYYALHIRRGDFQFKVSARVRSEVRSRVSVRVRVTAGVSVCCRGALTCGVL